DAGAKKRKEPPQLLKRLDVKLPLVLFIEQKSDRLTALGYTNGTWFTVVGVKAGKNVVWKFMHLEPYLRRTDKGTAAEMVKTVRDVVAGKKKAPPVNKNEKPGLGPEVKKTSAFPSPSGFAGGKGVRGAQPRTQEEGRRSEDKHRSYSSFILHPSSFDPAPSPPTPLPRPRGREEEVE